MEQLVKIETQLCADALPGRSLAMQAVALVDSSSSREADLQQREDVPRDSPIVILQRSMLDSGAVARIKRMRGAEIMRTTHRWPPRRTTSHAKLPGSKQPRRKSKEHVMNSALVAETLQNLMGAG